MFRASTPPTLVHAFIGNQYPDRADGQEVTGYLHRFLGSFFSRPSIERLGFNSYSTFSDKLILVVKTKQKSTQLNVKLSAVYDGVQDKPVRKCRAAHNDVCKTHHFGEMGGGPPGQTKQQIQLSGGGA